MASKTKTRRWVEKQARKQSKALVLWSGRKTKSGFVAASNKVSSSVSTAHANRVELKKNGTARDRHPAFSALGDFVSDLGHSFWDWQDLKNGIMTPAEWDEYEKIGTEYLSEKHWRREMHRRRGNLRAADWAAQQKDGKWLPIQTVATLSLASLSEESRDSEIVPAFRVPQPRKGQPQRAAQSGVVRIHPRPMAVRRLDRATQLRGAWSADWKQQKEKAMSDMDVQAAIACLKALSEQQPSDREQLHAQLAAFAAIGEAMGEASEAIKAHLERPQRDGTPGVPSEVTTHLTPVSEHGAAISRACQDTANAFEDRFADAIKAAQDEQKMSDQFLRAQPA